MNEKAAGLSTDGTPGVKGSSAEAAWAAKADLTDA